MSSEFVAEDERKYERMQSASAGPNPPDISPGTGNGGQLSREGKPDPNDLVPNMDGLDLHDSEREAQSKNVNFLI